MQLVRLLILGVPVACVSWTVTHEEVFRELHEGLTYRSTHSSTRLQRKVFYLLTCEYCFSHYVAAVFVAIVHFKSLVPGWPGFMIAWFRIVWVANAYMSLFGRLRLDIKHEHIEIAASQTDQQLKVTSMRPTKDSRNVLSNE